MEPDKEVRVTERAEQLRWGSLFRWLARPEPEPTLLSPWPLRRAPGWPEHVNQPLMADELSEVRQSFSRGRPYGGPGWVAEHVSRLNKSAMAPDRVQQGS